MRGYAEETLKIENFFYGFGEEASVKSYILFILMASMTQQPTPPPEISEQIAKALIKYARPLIGLTAAGTGIYYLSDRRFLEAAIATAIAALVTLLSSFGEGLMEVLKAWMNKRGQQSGIGITKAIDQLLSTLGWIVSGFRGQYIKSVADSCRDLKIEGFKIGLPVLDLEDVFVPLKVATGLPAQMSGAMVQTLDETESQGIWDFLHQSRKIPGYRRIAILAPPGYGKTTLLQHLTLIYARKGYRKRKVPNLIPVLIYLRNVRKQLTATRPPNLAALIESRLKTQPLFKELKLPSNWFNNQLKRGHCLVMLDGLDEVADAGERLLISRWVNRQIKQYRQSQTIFILTSRPHAYQSNVLDEVGLVLQVKPFTLDQVKQFIQGWYLQTEIRSRQGRDDRYVRELAKENADKLINAIIHKPAIRQMASNPLLVTMIATVHYCGDALPGRRVELYQKICDVLLGARQVAKQIDTPMTKEQNKSVLQDLALKLMLQEQRGFTLEEGKALIQKRLKTVSDTFTPEDFLEQIKEVSGLLVEKQVGLYEFAHLSLQEYLAAAQIKESQQESILTRNFQNPWWAETIRLYAAQGDATNLIQTALNFHKKTVQVLSLAWDCQKEGLQVNPAVRKRLEKILEAGLESSDDAALARRAATVKLSRRLNQLLKIDESTAIDMDYITRAEYRLANPHVSLDRAKEPITNIQFPDAVKFCNWLSINAAKLHQSQENKEDKLLYYRLPTREELQQLNREHAHLPCWSTYRSKPNSGIRIVREQAKVPKRYLLLLQYLVTGQWQEADKETFNVMRQIVGRRMEVEEINQFPCKDLHIINQLWVQFSGGRFGFSIQRDIYIKVGGKLDGKYNQTTWYKFCDRVKWREDGKFLPSSHYTFNPTGVLGHLPNGHISYWLAWGWVLFSRITHCRL